MLPNSHNHNNMVADYYLNRLQILSNLSYTSEIIGIPILTAADIDIVPNRLVAFGKAMTSKCYDAMIHFYESDKSFVRILNNPIRYGEILKRFKYVISPDFSQRMDAPPFICFQNSWWNKALGAYWQSLGINVIPNVAWSRPDSYSYAFSGIPKNSVIAINCTGIKGKSISKYFWMKGYEAALKALNPSKIIRYGDRMPGEDYQRSIYFENENLNRLRNGC